MATVRQRLRGALVTGAVLIGIAIVLAVTGVLRVPGLSASHRGKSAAATKAKEPSNVLITVAPVTPRVVQRTVTLVGNLNGYEEVTVTPKAEGRVVKVYHDLGDIVKPGDTLLEIDDVEYRLAVAEAQRALELELAKIGLSEFPKGDLDHNRIPTVVRARTMEENSLLKRNRAQRLRSTGASGQEEQDQAQADYHAARAVTAQAVMEANATLASARHKQAMLDIAKQRLAETKVFVPIPSVERLNLAGKEFAAVGVRPDAKIDPANVEFVVAQRMVSEGEMVRAFPSMSAFRLVIDRPLKLVGPVPERHAGEVKIGQSVGLVVEAFPDETFKGIILRVNPTIDRGSRTFIIEAHVANDERRLKAGGFAKAAILTSQDNRALTVPEEAIVSFAGVTKVFVVEDGKAKAVPVSRRKRIVVTEDGRASNWVEVVGNLSGAREVVTSGLTQLADGTPVHTRGPDEKVAEQEK